MNYFSRIISLFGLLIAAAIFITACKQPAARIIQSPPGYDFSKVVENEIDLRLKEISGLVWDTKDDEFMAHNDESGKLFILDRETKDIRGEYVFGGKGDYEDIALLNDIPYILRSDGLITRVIYEESGAARGVEEGSVPISGKNDFETMYADTSRNALIVICKNCQSDNKATVSAYAYFPGTGVFDAEPVYVIDAEKVKELSPHKTSKFQPSSAAIHPITKKLFIISSASNQLVVADQNGIPEGVYELGKKLFPQPEGITFKNNGDMYISNEGVTSKATILRFIYTGTPAAKEVSDTSTVNPTP